MSTASSNLSRLLLLKETAYGTVPTVGTPSTLRFTSESLKFGLTSETSQEIRPDRNIVDMIRTGVETSGDINFELSYGTYDVLIEAALGGTWTSDVLKNGVTNRSFSIEQGFTDINQYIAYKGMGVNAMNLEFALESIVTGSFGLMGSDAQRAGAKILPGTPSAATTTEPMDSVSGFADLMIGGNAVTCGISRVTLATTAGLRAQKSLGKLGACAMNLGTLGVTGEIVVYFSDGALYDKYVANQSLALTWKAVDKAGNSYTFLLPKIKFSDGTVNAGGLDQDVELTLPYQALFDPTEACTIKITRDDAPVAP